MKHEANISVLFCYLRSEDWNLVLQGYICSDIVVGVWVTV